MEPSSYIPRYIQPKPAELRQIQNKHDESRSREGSISFPDFATPEYLAKPHINAALKHMPDDETRATVLAGIPEQKKMFDDPKFAATMAKLRAFKAEDPLRIETKRRPAPPPITPATQPQLKPSTSAPPAPLSDLEELTMSLPRHRTVGNLMDGLQGRGRGMSISRDRWDVVPRGPVTPLSPTPTGNAFANGGFWEKSSPMAGPRTPSTAIPTTPFTAIPWSPMPPSLPVEEHSKEVYDEIRRDVSNLARTICARRLSTQGSSISNELGSFPSSMISSRDNLAAAEIILKSMKRGLRGPDPELPAKLNALIEEEAKTLKTYSLDSPDLEEVETWLQIDPETKEMTTIVDAQRDFAHMHRDRRKSGLLAIDEQALRLVWATRILEDAERAVKAQADVDSDVDQGYDYNNFLRSIKREVSSGSELSAMAMDITSGEACSIRSRATTVGTSSLSREVTELAEPLSGSPSKFINRAMRSKEALAENRKSWEKRLSSTAAMRGLSLITMDIKEETDSDIVANDHPSQETGPADKASRRMAASHLDLDRWAEELKNLHGSDPSIGDVESAQLHIHPALRRSWRNSMGTVGDTRSSTAEYFDETSGDVRDEVSARPSFEVQQSFTHLLSVFPTPPRHENTAPSSLASLKRIGSLLESGSGAPTGIMTSSDLLVSNPAVRRSTPLTPWPSVPPVPVTPPRSKKRISHSPGGTIFDTDSTKPQTHARTASTTSLHHSMRRVQHERSTSVVTVRDGAKAEDEDEWTRELKKMESREKVRQLEEFQTGKSGA